MADAYTDTTAMDLDQTAYDRLMFKPLRSMLLYDQIADVKPTRQSMPGSVVTFTIATEMAAATTPLTETVDPDAVALAESKTTVTLAEYGNATLTSALLRHMSYVEINPIVANLVGYNAGDSIDQVAGAVLEAGTNVDYALAAAVQATARNETDADATLSAADVRLQRARLVGNNVHPKFGTYYGAYIHPDCSLDLRTETGEAAWRAPKVYSEPADIMSGEIGAFEGFRFIESVRAPLFVDASDGAGGAGTIDVYGTLFCGQEALAKAHSSAEGMGPRPQTVIGPVTDKLKRFRPVGWYWLGGYAIFRQNAVRRVESSSSIGDNA